MEEESTRYSRTGGVVTRTIRVQIAFCHPSKRGGEILPDGEDDADYESIWATIHPLDEAGDSTGLWCYEWGTGESATLLGITADLGIDPDDRCNLEPGRRPRRPRCSLR